MKGRIYLLLCWLGMLGMLGIGSPLSAQPSNDSLCAQLVHSFLTEHPGPYLELAGLPQKVTINPAWQDSSSQQRLRLWPIRVQYSLAQEGLISRNILLPYTLETPQLKEDTLRYSDMLTRKELKRVIQASSPELQGDPPFRWERWGRPLAWGGAGILLTTLLFYLRSP